MSLDGGSPTETAKTFGRYEAEDLVHLIASRAGLAKWSPRVKWVAGTSGSVRRTRTGIRLSLGQGILADEEDARFTIAHEVGHIVAGHVDRRTVLRTFAWLAVPVVVVPQSLIAVGLTLGGVRGGRALGGFAPLLIIVIYHLLIRRILQPRELEADDFAAQQQCPLTAGLAERYQERDHKERIAGLGRLVRWAFPTHPSWATRAARL